MKIFKKYVVVAVMSFQGFMVIPSSFNFGLPDLDTLNLGEIPSILVSADTDITGSEIMASLVSNVDKAGTNTKPGIVVTPAPTKTAADPEANGAPTNPIPAPVELDGWFTTYGNAYNINPDVLKIIAKCESHFNPSAASGPYGGMYQYMASTWSSTRNAMGLDPDPALRFNAEESIKTTAWKISVGGIGAWPHCSKKAIAHAGSPIKPSS